MGKLKNLQAKKKDIDIFGILLGLILGFCLGYFLISPNTGNSIEDVVQDDVYGTVYLLELGRSSSVSNLDSIKNSLDSDDLNCVYVNNSSYYSLYSYITCDLNLAKSKKTEFEAMGYSVSIISIYLLDLANYCYDDYERIFYKEAIDNLLKSISNETFYISQDYYLDPININVFSNLSVLQNIKNDKIKQFFELDTFKILIETLK